VSILFSGFGLVLLAVVPYLRMFPGEFLYDDPWMFRPMHPGYSRVDYFRHDVRAMVHFFDALLFRAVGVNRTGLDETGTVIIQPAYPWHVLSLAFHVGTVLCVWSLAGYILEPGRAFFAAAVYAVHPLQVSAVGMISARAGVQSAFFSAVGALHAIAGGWHWAAVPLCAYFSFKSKPDGLLLFGLYLGILWFR